jgi:hypothetical protein
MINTSSAIWDLKSLYAVEQLFFVLTCTVFVGLSDCPVLCNERLLTRDCLPALVTCPLVEYRTVDNG